MSRLMFSIVRNVKNASTQWSQVSSIALCISKDCFLEVISKCICLCNCLCLCIFVGQGMSLDHSDQMSQTPQVSSIAFEMCSLNLNVFVFVFLLVISCLLITLITCLNVKVRCYFLKLFADEEQLTNVFRFHFPFPFL